MIPILDVHASDVFSLDADIAMEQVLDLPIHGERAEDEQHAGEQLDADADRTEMAPSLYDVSLQVFSLEVLDRDEGQEART